LIRGLGREERTDGNVQRESRAIGVVSFNLILHVQIQFGILQQFPVTKV
jgi:hypothetical protein